LVEPLRAVAGRRHRAHGLAGGVLAVHAGEGLEVRAQRLLRGPLVVGVDADPVHLASVQDLGLADDRDVVLGLALEDAPVASDAGVEVDLHRPLVAMAVVARRIEGEAALALPALLPALPRRLRAEP